MSSNHVSKPSADTSVMPGGRLPWICTFELATSTPLGNKRSGGTAAWNSAYLLELLS